MCKNLFSFLLWMLLSISVCGQGGIVLSGKIENNKADGIAGATIHLLNTNLGAVSDSFGNFRINGLKAGKYILQVSAIGFTTVVLEVNAFSDNTGFIINLPESFIQIDEVYVTAEKSEQFIQQIPYSVSVLSSRQVNDYRLWNSKDITAIIPNLYSANPGDNRNVTSIRGITSTSYDPAVATYIDGVNQFGLDTYIAQLFDIERIEVLRGPQGTLYGRNAMGGVINIITMEPANIRTGFAEINLGNHNQQRYSAGIKLPLIKNKLFAGIAELYEERNGFYSNEFNHSSFDKQHSLTGNYYLKFIPVPHFSITANVKHQNNRNKGIFPLSSSISEAFDKPFILNQNAITRMKDNIFNSSLSAIYTGKRFNFSLQSGFQSNYRFYKKPIDADFSPLDAVTIFNNYGRRWNNVKVFTQELRFSSPATISSWKWIAGAYFFHQYNPVKQATRFGKDAGYIGIPDSNFSIINTTTAKTNGIAFYGQASYSINSEWSVTGGLRYDHEHKKQHVLGEYQHDPDPDPIFAIRPDTSASVMFSAFSPKISTSYKISASHNLYATYSRGYRTGGFTPLTSDPSQLPLFSFKPEFSNNYEVGTKNNFFKNRLRLNVTFFYTSVTNAQLPTLVLPDAVTITRNAGKLTSKGVETEFTSTSLAWLQVDHNFGYTDAKYEKGKLSQNGSELDLEGKKQVFTPEFTSMLALQYNYKVPGKYIKFLIRGEWFFLGDQFFDPANTIKQSSYSLFHTKVGFGLKNFEILFWGRNLLNKKYIAYAYDFGAVHLGDPITYGVSLRGRF